MAGKNTILDKFTKSGRLRERLNEIQRSADEGRCSRMDAGDQIGRHIVANLADASARTVDETRLYFEAQRARAVLYEASEAATAVEAAEALIEAYAVAHAFDDRAGALSTLVETGCAVLDGLTAVGSKRTAWNIARIVYEAVDGSPAHEPLRRQALDQYLGVLSRLAADSVDPGVLEPLLDLCESVKRTLPDRVAAVVGFVPRFLALSLGEMPLETALRAYHFARFSETPVDIKTRRLLVERLAAEGRIDTEARVVYQEFLAAAGKYRARSEKIFEDLAYVNPDPDVRFDADRDALMTLLSEHYPEGGWIWRNRGLLLRKRGDPVGALACLGRAMTISGDPPELLGLLSPIVHGMGFDYSAREFARFVPVHLHTRFSLHLLEDFVDTPESDARRIEILGRMDRALKRADTPPELQSSIRLTRARLLRELGRTQEAVKAYREALDVDPTSESAAIGIAEIAFESGEVAGARAALETRFSPETAPFVGALQARIAEAAGDPGRAAEWNAGARGAMDAAQAASRDRKVKTLVVLADRMRRLFGDEVAEGPLFVMLQTEAHALRNARLDAIEADLERRAVELSLASGRPEEARRIVHELVERRPADTAVYVHGIRAGLRAGKIEDARWFVAEADRAGHGKSVDVALLRGLVAWQGDHRDEAKEAFGHALADRPKAETRLAVAAVLLEAKKEDAALEILSRFNDEETGSVGARIRLYDLRARLLERKGRRIEALDNYLAALELDPGHAEARRRAGMLAVSTGMAADGSLIDEDSIRRGLELLAGENDPEAVVHAALGAAAVESSAAKAAADLGICLKRLSPKHATIVHEARAAFLLAAGDCATARHELLALLEDSGPETDLATVTAARRCLASLFRREAAAVLDRDGARPDDAVRAARAALAEGESIEPSEIFATLGAALARIQDRSAPLPTLASDAPTALRAIVELAEFGKAEGVSAIESLAETLRDSTTVAALRLALALERPDEPADRVIAAFETAVRAGSASPFGRQDVMRAAALRAIVARDGVAADAAIERGGAELAELRAFRCFEREALGGGAVDQNRLAAAFRDLDHALRARGTSEPALERRLAAIQARMTEARENPSPAWASAKLRVAGKRTRASAPEVLRFWKDEIAAGRNRSEARHALALLELSRAHESERSGSDAGAWREAHAAWAALLKHEEFWNAMAARLESAHPGRGTASVAKVRSQIPRFLLQSHLAWARTRLHSGAKAQGIEHGRLVATSPLLALAESKMRDELCFALSGDLEKHLHLKRYEEALGCLDQVIVADPTNPPARREMARIAALWVRQSMAVIDALTTPPSAAMVSEVCGLMSRVLVTVERPILELVQHEAVEPASATDAAVCLRAMAYVAFHRDHDAKRAAELADLAISVARTGGVEVGLLVRFRTEIGLADVERTMTRLDTPTDAQQIADPIGTALAEIDKLLEMDPDNPKVITQKARLLMARDRDEEAEALARDLFQKAQKKAEPARVRAAVELLHQVQAGRERFKLESKSQLVDRLMKERNWRDALTILKEILTGHENDVENLRRHVEILLGLHRTERVAELIDQLAAAGGHKAVVSVLEARLGLLNDAARRGGDGLAAFELYERGEMNRVVRVASDAVAKGDGDGYWRLLLSLAYAALGESGTARRHAEEAKKRAPKSAKTWYQTLIEQIVERKTS